MALSPDIKKKILKQKHKSSISELSRELNVSRRAVKQVIKENEEGRARQKKLMATVAFGLLFGGAVAAGIIYYLGTLPPPAAKPKDRNLLVVTIDTCRADHLGCYGYAAARTPLIDSIAKQGVMMERAYAIQPITLPSHATIFTGVHPRKHGVHDNGLYKLPQEALTMAEVLQEKGYLTAAIISAFVLNRQFGLSQGFMHYDDKLSDSRQKHTDIAEMKATVVSDRAIKWIGQNADKKWFLWLHYFDPHAGYAPPERFKTPGRHPYEGEIAYVDHELKRVFNELKKHNLRRKTVVVITSDHGESLGEHGEGTHGMFLYNATMHVPLIFSLPGALPQGKTRSEMVSLMDLMPTALEMLGVKAPPSVQGRSIIPLLTGDADDWKEAPLAMETMLPWDQFGWSPYFALVKNGYKYIEAPQPELYDMEDDPRELVNIYGLNKGRAEAMARELKKELKHYGQETLAGQSKREMDSKDKKQLASLGYIMSGDRGEACEEAPDAKKMLEIKKQYEKALRLKGEGKTEEGLKLLKEVVQKDPGNIKATISLAEWLRLDGKLNPARDYLEKVIEKQPRQVEAYIKLALVYVDRGEAEKAEKTARKALDLGVKRHKAYRIMGIVYLMKEDYDKSMEQSKKAIELYPNYHQAYAGLAAAYNGMEEYDKALEALYTANRIAPEKEMYKKFIKDIKKRRSSSRDSQRNHGH